MNPYDSLITAIFQRRYRCMLRYFLMFIEIKATRANHHKHKS